MLRWMTWCCTKRCKCRSFTFAMMDTHRYNITFHFTFQQTQLCQGLYTKQDIEQMEQDILFSLEWKVTLPSSMDFVRQFLEASSISPSTTISRNNLDLLKVCEQYLDKTTSYIYYANYTPSSIATASLSLSFNELNVPIEHQQYFWLTLSNELGGSLFSMEVREIRQRLLEGLQKRKSTSPSTWSCCTTVGTSSYCSEVGISSDASSTSPMDFEEESMSTIYIDVSEW